MKCKCCEEEYEESELLEEVCDGCRTADSDDPAATVLYGNDDEPVTVGTFHDDTEGDFRVRWVKTDPWRGYYEVESDTYVKVHDDCILSYSEDERELKRFDTALREYCDEHGIRYARVFARSSNLFSVGYDFFVAKEDVKRVEEFMLLAMKVTQLASEHRDSERFTLTALTGKSDGFDEEDEALVEVAKLLGVVR